MNYDIDPAKATAAIDDLTAQVRAENTPEVLAKRKAAEREGRFTRKVRYARQCDAGDAMILGARIQSRSF